MFKHTLLSLSLLILISCDDSIPKRSLELNHFSESENVLLPDSILQMDVLFIGEHHKVTNKDGNTVSAKQNHDFTGYIPINGRSDSGYVIVNHELIISDPHLGDGGGMTVFTVFYDKNDKQWNVVDAPQGKFRNVDFSSVGGTIANCGGFQTTWGTVLTAEEWMSESNQELYKKGEGITDTSNFEILEFNGEPIQQSIPKYLNYNWMVEVDVANAIATQKHYAMGRTGHEGGILLPDEKTVFLTDDNTPSFIFKFVAHQKRDLSSGQLYAYKETSNGGEWLEMPMKLDSMLYIREVAARRGATMFIRTEWAEHHDGKIYFTETGNNNTEDAGLKYQKMGSKWAKHLQEIDMKDGVKDGKIHDYYGRILSIDINTGQLEVYLNGGGDSEVKHLSNPDCITKVELNGKTFLVINEDLNGSSHGRVPAGYNNRINEIWWLDMSIENPEVSDLKRFMIGPKGCETTGGRFTPDGSTYFVNIQHPNTENVFPFNHSCTVAITGIKEWVEAVF